MSYLPIFLLTAMSVMAVSSANAQEANSASDLPIPGQSSTLVTQPVSVNQPGKTFEQKGQPLNPSKLNEISGSISGKPQPRPKEPSIIPDSVIPESLLPKWEPKPIDPLSDFKVPPLDGGLRVPIN
ncbi:MAG: hypothetical protein WCA35_08735 [Kovacikia sp.]